MPAFIHSLPPSLSPLLSSPLSLLSAVVEESDAGRESPSIARGALDDLVMGRCGSREGGEEGRVGKVKEAVDRPEMSSITEGLKLSVASRGR